MEGKKKKKYWLIPVSCFLVAVISLMVPFLYKLIGTAIKGVEVSSSSFVTTFFLIIGMLATFALLPAIIIAIVLSVTNKNK